MDFVDSEKLDFDDSLIEKAINEDIESIKLMFEDFISSDEQVLYCDYFGIKGLWGFGCHTWGCVTNKRVATLELEPFRKLLYKDVFHEKIDHGIIYQPHYFSTVIFLLIVSISWAALLFPITDFIHFFISKKMSLRDTDIQLLLSSFMIGFSFPVVLYTSIRGYYRLVKHGLVYIIHRDQIYLFATKKYMPKILDFHKYATSAKTNGK